MYMSLIEIFFKLPLNTHSSSYTYFMFGNEAKSSVQSKARLGMVRRAGNRQARPIKERLDKVKTDWTR